MPDEPCLYTAALDAGDRLVSALHSGDLGGAARVLGERSQIIASIQLSASPSAPEHLAERFREQDLRLNTVLGQRMTSAQEAVSSTGQAALAHDRYASTSAPAPIVDTAPRRG